MIRSTLAILAGFIAWSVLWLAGNVLLSSLFSGAFREDGSTGHVGILIFLVLYSLVISIISGYITAQLANHHRLRHSLILGTILLVVGIFVQLQFWTVLPLWYHFSFLVLLVPGAYLGAKIYQNSRA